VNAGPNKNEFPLRLDVTAVKEIARSARETGMSVPDISKVLTMGIEHKDMPIIGVIQAIERYMRERHCEPGFEVVIE
jgi:hypothetical protein